MKLVRGFAYLTAEEIRQVDETAIGEYGIDVLSLMENAGEATAEMARRVLGDNVASKRVTCLVGKGNNGGDGLVAARHLHNWGAEVGVVLGAPRDEFHDIAARQLSIVEKMGLQVVVGPTGLTGVDLIVDALLGYNAKGDPRGAVAELIRLSRASGAPVLGLDLPSGLDSTTGHPGDPCIEADWTITLGFPKAGFLNPDSRPFVGELYLCDIALPREFYARQDMSSRIFEKDRIVRIEMSE